MWKYTWLGISLVLKASLIILLFFVRVIILCDPGHSISNKTTCAPSKDSNQPLHPRNLMSSQGALWMGVRV